MNGRDKHCAVLIIDDSPEKISPMLATLQKEYGGKLVACSLTDCKAALSMPEDTVLLDMTLNKTDATRIRHELANANHAILLGASLLSRYWEDLVSHMDMLDDAHEEQSSCDEDCREARKNGSTVIENIIKSARRIEVHLAKLREDALDSVGTSA
ncbi:MAG: hypothetical protein OEL57_14070 [Trichlorobacter sp.]|uniref:hypothetical protein n=1 Tax=Trichlorobacter sp. TaxID=2911007 RepID=UPI00256E76B4|nr:hypothetical protein [Trichlorobacter sp.]MDK9719010.1 hypothetical protein [Trichlorobacter sp.]